MTDQPQRFSLWHTGSGLSTVPPGRSRPAPPLAACARPATVASTCRACPAGCGMLVTLREGAPVRAAGNPGHPVNRGALCALGESALFLYRSPDRERLVLERKEGRRPQKSSWQQALCSVSARLRGGGRVAVLSRLETGALAEVMSAFAGAFRGELLFFEPFTYEAQRSAHQQLFGRPVVPRYELEGSDFILSLAADFLETWTAPADLDPAPGQGPHRRFAYVGPRLSFTASCAETFLQVPAGAERPVAAALLQIMLERGWQKREPGFARGAVRSLVAAAGPVTGVGGESLLALARDFARASRPVALAGPLAATGPVATDTALLAALLNYATGAVDDAVDFSRPHAVSFCAREAELSGFFGSLNATDILFVHDTDPAGSRPGAAAAMGRAGLVVYLGSELNETARLAHFFLPLDHVAESWGEFQPEPGVRGLVRPVAPRRYETRCAGDLFLELARLAGRPLCRPGGQKPAGFAAWLRESWLEQAPPDERQREKAWSEALQRGGEFEAQGARPAPATRLLPGSPLFRAAARSPSWNGDEAELWPWTSVMRREEGSCGVVELNPRQAAALEVAEGDLVQVDTAAGSLRAPARLTAGVSAHTAAIALPAPAGSGGAQGANPVLLLGATSSSSTFAACRIGKVPGQGDSSPVPSQPA